MTDTGVKSVAREYCDLLARTYHNNFRGSYTPIDYILKHGQSWGPRVFPDHIQQGPEHQCFKTSALLAIKHDNLRYVEGFATSVIPMPHAWLVDSDGNVIDPTWDKTYGDDYFGVEIPTQTLLKVILKTDQYGVLSFENWDKILKILRANS
jgi:hypothetical protein